MYRKYIKRLLDIVLAIIMLPFVMIILIIFIPIIVLEDRGSPFYNAKRLGFEREVFTMYKLRSMKVNAPDIRNEDGSTFNSDDDPRLTKVGKLIRKSSIDELPQIFNILKGNMSFIGPRPDLPESISIYKENEFKRLEVFPGITGYAQAYVRNSVLWKERIKYDIYYVEHISFFLDIKILIKTVETVLGRKNVYVK